MEHFQSTLGIVIKSRTIKESDILVTLLTPHSGKITMLAKGAKNIKSTRLGSLQLGNIIKAHIYQKNNYLWLSETQTVSQFLQTSKNLTQLGLLFYFMEILNYLIADNQQIEGIYEISENVIKAINNNNFVAFIKHEIEFINLLGFGIPKSVETTFHHEDYITCQKEIKQFLESIIEKPLHSNKLFK